MISEINKSVSAILYERVTSPFYGALITSWCAWNWKIIYITLFVSEQSLQKNKIEWIIENCSNSNYLIVFPLISTLIILTAIPFVANGAYWLQLIFIKWRRDKKNSIDMKTLLTTEQSIQIREELIKTEEKFDNLLNRKNQEIKELNIQLESLRKTTEEPEPETAPENSDQPSEKSRPIDSFLGAPTVSGLADKIKNSDELLGSLNIIIQYIQNGWMQLADHDDLSSTSLAFFEVNHLIKNDGSGMYSMTDLGRDVVKVVLNDKF